MFRRVFCIAARFAAALTPMVYLQLHYSLPDTKSGQDLAALLTGWFVIACAALAISARYLLARKAER